MRNIAIIIVTGAVLAGSSVIDAQSLAQRIAAVRDGRVQLRFASRNGVCGNGRGSIGTGGHSVIGEVSSSSDSRNWRDWCEPGPVRTVLTVHGGTVERARVFVGGSDSAADVHDLGLVSATESANYFLDLARRGDRGQVGDQAILAAVLADSVTPWPALLSIARDNSLPRATHASAMFWLSQATAAVVNQRALFGDRDSDTKSDRDDVRAEAIFALSQQPHDVGVPALIRVARTNRNAELRSKALFWLGQSGDPRATDLFAELLKGKNP
jgi:hypothetical protein